MAGPTPRPFLRAFACSTVVFIAIIALVIFAWGPPRNANASNLFGQLFALTFIPAIITGFIARRAKTAWSTMKIAIVYLVVLAAMFVITVAGKIRPQSTPSG
jgi:hypothetical protein